MQLASQTGGWMDAYLAGGSAWRTLPRRRTSVRSRVANICLFFFPSTYALSEAREDTIIQDNL